MGKQNAMLNRIESSIEARYNAMFRAKLRMLLQIGQDAALLTAHDVLHLGPGRAVKFCETYRERVNEMAHFILEAQTDDPEFVYAKAKIDDRVREVVGDENFAPWEERYGN